jgi:hypothetical protein
MRPAVLVTATRATGFVMSPMIALATERRRVCTPPKQTRVLGDHLNPVRSVVARSPVPIVTNAESMPAWLRSDGVRAMSFIIV